MPDAYTWHAAGSWSLDLLRPGRKHANRSFLKQSTYTSLMVQPCSGYVRSPDLHFSEHLRCNGERSLSAEGDRREGDEKSKRSMRKSCGLNKAPEGQRLRATRMSAL